MSTERPENRVPHALDSHDVLAQDPALENIDPLEQPAPEPEVESYGIHRFSTTTRLVFTFALVALVTAAIFVAIQFVMASLQGIELTAVLNWGMLIAIVLAVILSTLLGLFSARGITKPISKIIDTVNAIKSGSYSARTGFTGYDEIGSLGSTLDEMADTIERNQEYERQITVEVAHELRTPLMAMQANLEGMIDGVMPADAEHLVAVNSEVIRLGRLVEGQLKLSRLEARKVEFHPRKFDVGELIGRLSSNYQLLVESLGLVLDSSIEEEVFIYADPDMIRQAAANLVSNAIRYTPEGGRIKVMVRRQGQTAEIEVADTGIGIDEAELSKVFDKFWRSSADNSRDTGGLGIGLATVREIVNIHKGKVIVQSQLGIGSSFIIVLPLSK